MVCVTAVMKKEDWENAGGRLKHGTGAMLSVTLLLLYLLLTRVKALRHKIQVYSTALRNTTQVYSTEYHRTHADAMWE